MGFAQGERYSPAANENIRYGIGIHGLIVNAKHAVSLLRKKL